MSKLLSKLGAEIAAEHELASSKAREAVLHALRCGELLLSARDSVADGNWREWLSAIGIPITTAARYMRVAADRDTKALLDRGASLVDLYRAFGLVRELEGGGYRSEVYQQRKLLGASGVQMHFEFDAIAPQLAAVEKSVEALKRGALGPDKLQVLHDKLSRCLAVVAQALAQPTTTNQE